MERLTDYELEKVVNLLIGEVEPYGDSSIDEIRLWNLKCLCSLTEHCLERICEAYSYRERQEGSMKKIADEAGYFLSETLKDLKQAVKWE